MVLDAGWQARRQPTQSPEPLTVVGVDVDRRSVLKSHLKTKISRVSHKESSFHFSARARVVTVATINMTVKSKGENSWVSDLKRPP